MPQPITRPPAHRLDVLALANTLALIDLVLHPLFHLWGWVAPRSYEAAMHEFVIGLHLRVDERFTPTFILFWILEAAAFWLLGAIAGLLYNRLAGHREKAGGA
jgi:hypothetical protein